MKDPQPINEFKVLILNSEDTYETLDRFLTPSPSSFLQNIDSILSEPAASDNDEILEKIRGALREWKRDLAQEKIDAQRMNPEDDDILEIFEGIKDRGSASLCETINALGANEFDIQIFQIGPLFFIQANEFDDIEWFGSEEDALAHAREEFSTFIEAYEHQWDCDEEDCDDDGD